MVDAIDSYWGPLYCINTLILPLLTQTYKWILDMEQGGGGAAEVTSISALSITLVPNAF